MGKEVYTIWKKYKTGVGKSCLESRQQYCQDDTDEQLEQKKDRAVDQYNGG